MRVKLYPLRYIILPFLTPSECEIGLFIRGLELHYVPKTLGTETVCGPSPGPLKAAYQHLTNLTGS